MRYCALRNTRTLRGYVLAPLRAYAALFLLSPICRYTLIALSGLTIQTPLVVPASIHRQRREVNGPSIHGEGARGGGQAGLGLIHSNDLCIREIVHQNIVARFAALSHADGSRLAKPNAMPEAGASNRQLFDRRAFFFDVDRK